LRLVAGGWFVLREKYCWLVADKPSEQAVKLKQTCTAFFFLDNLSDRVGFLAQKKKTHHSHKKNTSQTELNTHGLLTKCTSLRF
jgi:hypothetical protein